MSGQDTNSLPPPLALPAPSDVLEETEKITVNGTQTFKFDKLGPVVVNKDGTLSRIANWEEMTPIEKERTLRILVARNQYDVPVLGLRNPEI
ncbi:hypothetical protein GSI_11407 [Ganoderma sinense ZZ0214-1]|uniref:Uncharacterized protein n=1 Tax=Ganoderma sinense ZZ0214-1 TaxID=1077348 RepID=A0A2G8RVX9_9APHY|nr:hypothetical protein GSI_11407 [Ganoderma sinense ZZ0214-1]